MSSLQPRIARLKTNEVFVIAGEVVGCKNFRGYLEKCETCFNGGPTNKSCLKRYPKKLQRWEEKMKCYSCKNREENGRCKICAINTRIERLAILANNHCPFYKEELCEEITAEIALRMKTAVACS